VATPFTCTINLQIQRVDPLLVGSHFETHLTLGSWFSQRENERKTRDITSFSARPMGERERRGELLLSSVLLILENEGSEVNLESTMDFIFSGFHVSMSMDIKLKVVTHGHT
jgi:hypothetical protein